MTIDEARIVIREWIQEDGGLYDLGQYLGYNAGAGLATLDGQFTADELEAVAVFMRASAEKP